MRWYEAGLAFSLSVVATPAAAQPSVSTLRLELTGPRLARALSDPSVTRRVEAADALGRLGAPGPAVDALVEALPAEPARQVRVAIARSLARRGDPRAVPALVEALAETRGPDAEATVAALASFGTGEAIGALLGALEDAHLERYAAFGLERVGARAVPSLVAHLADSPSPLPILAVLGRIGSPLGTSALLDALSSTDPAVRAAALTAIERIADPRAARAALAALEDPDPTVRRAAISAVGATGSRADAARLERLLTGGADPDVLTLRAILRLDPARAADVLLARPVGPWVVAAALERPRHELLPVFARWAGSAEVLALAGPGLYGAIAAVGDDAAIELLSTLAERAPPEARDTIAVELALALERSVRSIGPEARARGLAAIAAVADPAARLLLLAVAGDPAAAEAVDAALASEDPSLRSAAALAIATTRVRCRPNTVLETARRGDPELFRRMAEAALRCGVAARASVYRPFFYGEAAGPEAMAWAALSSREAPVAARRALGRELRAALRSRSPRIRAGAARALAIAGDREARRALVRLLDDREPGVRRAAARALEVLGPGAHAAEIEALARLETDPLLRVALEDAARGDAQATSGFDRSGHGSYRAPPSTGPGAQIDLADALGRPRRFVIHGSVPFVVAGLPDGPMRAAITAPAPPSGEQVDPSGTLAVPPLGP